MKRWHIYPQAPEDYLNSLANEHIHPVVAQVLYNRGFVDTPAALGFLGHYLPDDNPFRLWGMDDAIYRIRTAVRNAERIAVYGDFDCDGVTATVLLTEVLQRVGADVQAYIPNRVDEGYGLNTAALRYLAEDGVDLVITVDCGIRSVEEVAEANASGLDMIVTDHHSIGPELPPALAVINPRRAEDNYPEKRLSGVGIAYKMAQALFMEAQRRGIRGIDEWRPEDWLDLVAVGTVSDIVSLRGENRDLVQRGLVNLNRPQRPGLQALYSAARVRPGSVDATTIGFVIGPRINAAGRLRSAMLAYDLLTAPDIKRAMPLAEELSALNVERQQKTRDMQKWAEEHIGGADALMFAADERFEQGIVGLVASRLTEQYYRPSVVVQIGEEESHGSCRSIPEFHITRALEMCDDLLERYGGHAAAAGFTVRTENLSALQDRLSEIADDVLAGRDLQATLHIDAQIPLVETGYELVKALQQLEPTGEANRAPLFLTEGVRIHERMRVGREGRHLKMRFTDDNGAWADAIAFRRGEQADSLPDRIYVVYHLELNEWNGHRRPQLNVQDIHPSEEP
ncbi:MAG: single-stranded-DNA-specific exonuclease RecJ [Anaerolineae bacterium]